MSKFVSKSYDGVHQELRARYGPAAGFLCKHCLDKVAKDWAYDHKDPEERVVITRGKETILGSDSKYYIPLCRSCHSKLDQQHLHLATDKRTLRDRSLHAAHMRWHVKRSTISLDCSLCMTDELKGGAG